MSIYANFTKTQYIAGDKYTVSEKLENEDLENL